MPSPSRSAVSAPRPRQSPLTSPAWAVALTYRPERESSSSSRASGVKNGSAMSPPSPPLTENRSVAPSRSKSPKAIAVAIAEVELELTARGRHRVGADADLLRGGRRVDADVDRQVDVVDADDDPLVGVELERERCAAVGERRRRQVGAAGVLDAQLLGAEDELPGRRLPDRLDVERVAGEVAIGGVDVEARGRQGRFAPQGLESRELGRRAEARRRRRLGERAEARPEQEAGVELVVDGEDVEVAVTVGVGHAEVEQLQALDPRRVDEGPAARVARGRRRGCGGEQKGGGEQDGEDDRPSGGMLVAGSHHT